MSGTGQIFISGAEDEHFSMSQRIIFMKNYLYKMNTAIRRTLLLVPTGLRLKRFYFNGCNQIIQHQKHTRVLCIIADQHFYNNSRHFPRTSDIFPTFSDYIVDVGNVVKNVVKFGDLDLCARKYSENKFQNIQI